MLAHVRAHALLLVLTLFACSVLYPLAVLAVGQGAFRSAADGSLVSDDAGRVVGSRLIGQEFTGDEWFQPRPSAAGYNAAASAGSNYGANNPKLRDRVTDQLKAEYPGATAVPADAVTTSGSGLDPHITVANARRQLDRVVSAWAAKTNRDTAGVRTVVEQALDAAAFRPLAGLAGGDALVNVLELNLDLTRRFDAK